MIKERDPKLEKLADLFKSERAISANYENACSVLQDRDVALAVRFLIELDDLAARHDISPREIIMLLKPEYLNADADGAPTRSEGIGS
jgi:hypothetical protein